MTLTDEARALQKRAGGTCFFDGLDSALAAEIREALEDRSIQCSAISAALEKRGIEVSGDALRRHRLGRCRSCRS